VLQLERFHRLHTGKGLDDGAPDGFVATLLVEAMLSAVAFLSSFAGTLASLDVLILELASAIVMIGATIGMLMMFCIGISATTVAKVLTTVGAKAEADTGATSIIAPAGIIPVTRLAAKVTCFPVIVPLMLIKSAGEVDPGDPAVRTTFPIALIAAPALTVIGLCAVRSSEPDVLIVPATTTPPVFTIAMFPPLLETVLIVNGAAVLVSAMSPLVTLAALKLPTVFAPFSIVPPTESVLNKPGVLIAAV
jgi:hypothetical protein